MNRKTKATEMPRCIGEIGDDESDKKIQVFMLGLLVGSLAGFFTREIIGFHKSVAKAAITTGVEQVKNIVHGYSDP